MRNVSSDRARSAARIGAALALFASAAAASTEDLLGPLTVGIVAEANALPLVVAKAEGLFAAEGVDVRLVRFGSEAERDAALQAEALDGATTNLVSLLLSAQSGLELRAAGMTDGRCGIAASPKSDIRTTAGLKGASIALPVGTIEQFATDAMLARSGLRAGDYRATPVFDAEERLRSLLSGKIEAACLPEPYLSRARLGGAAVLASSSSLGLETGILAFRKEVLDSSLDAVAAFYRAYRAAAKMINEDNAKYRDLLVRDAGFPPAIRDSYDFVVYKRPRLPTRAEMASVAAWLSEAGLMPQGLDPQALLDGRALQLAFGGW